MSSAPRDFLIGTAGHVDHGKTALLAALTGIDCDRLPEEKRRGITLDLGFAHLVEDDLALGFVDVPGHERFLHNALAGLGGIRLLLLVVAADQGVRPQTREHLAIAELLNIDDALVVVSKMDLVDAETAELVGLEIAELLAGTRWAGASSFRVSATTGEGVEELRAALFARARSATPLASWRDPVRLPIDRAFSPRGQGAIVTGTLTHGVVRTGDELVLEPPGKRARVRGLQIHGVPRDEARAGARVALQLAGVELDELERGAELIGAGGVEPTRSLLVRLRLLDDAPLTIDSSIEVRLHLHATETPARLKPLDPPTLAPGETGIVALRTARPVVAARGDRIVVRRLSPATTLGGGELLDPHWRRPRRADLADRLRAFAGGDDDALIGWSDLAGASGLDPAVAAKRLGRSPEDAQAQLGELAKAGRLLAGAGRFFVPGRLATLEVRARQLLADYFALDRLADAMPKAELVKKLLPRRAAPLADFHLGWLAARKVIALSGDKVAPPGRSAELTSTETGLAAKIVAEYERAGLAPPSPPEAARRLAAKPAIVEGLIQHLVRRDRLARLPGGLLFARATLDRVAAELQATGWERFGIAQFKERFGLSRKWAIPILEHLDSRGITRRAGDERLVVASDRPPGDAAT